MRRLEAKHLLALCLALGCPAEAASAEPAEPAGSNVGYTVLDLKCGGAGGEQTLTVAVWYPTAVQPRLHTYGGPVKGVVAVDAPPLATGGPYPFFVFSHGYGGSGLSSVFFTEALAARGWIVACPDHHDKYSAVRIRSGAEEDFDRLGLLKHGLEIAASGPGDRGKYLYRLDEMQCALDGLLASEMFGALIDRDRIAVGGHSFGGFTALGLCGAIPERRDGRIRAVLLFSTGAGAYLFTESELAEVKMPSMLFLGERERTQNQKRGGRTMAELTGKIYGNLPPPKYLLEVKDAGHLSFNNSFIDAARGRRLGGTEKQFDVIRRYAIAFLERYVAGRKDLNRVLEQSDPMLTRCISETGGLASGLYMAH